MSAYLGPIHLKMYERILHQDGLTNALLALAEEKGWAEGLRAQADAQAPAASKQPLENLIDPSNIHGWLSAAVSVSERRHALIVGSILDGHPERMHALETAMRQAGRQDGSVSPEMDAEQAFRQIHDVLLDGMPCDFPFSITESGVDAVAWQVTDCPHAPHWTAELRAQEAYDRLRDAWVSGALEGTGLTHARTGCSHTLRRGQ